MFAIRKLALSALGTIAGIAGLVLATSGASIVTADHGWDSPGPNSSYVVADHGWDGPAPSPTL